MSARRGNGGAKLSRRRFVALLATGSTAAIAGPGLAAVRPRKRPVPKTTVPAAGPDAARREFERQRTQLLGALKSIREFRLPPGGDLPVVFRPLRAPRGTRRGGGGSGPGGGH